jgi:uncharacterized YccA/Bax inhibitor family protein
MGNPIIRIVGRAALLIKALFLRNDFDAAEVTVKKSRSEKYEYAAGHEPVFTVNWFYLKILSLLLSASNKN